MSFKGGDIICGLWKSFVGGGHVWGQGCHLGMRKIVWG